jgi:hypothetical protein
VRNFGAMGLMLPTLFACAGSPASQKLACPESRKEGAALNAQAASSSNAASDFVSVKEFVGTLPSPTVCGTPCAAGEESLRVGGSCLCASDVRTITNDPPPKDRWFFARGSSLVEVERSPLKACGEAPLETRGAQEAPLECPWSGRELLISYGTLERAAGVVNVAADTLVRVRTEQQPGVPTELQAVPFGLPSGSTVVGVFRDNPFSAPPGSAERPIFVAWRVLLPE